MAVTGEHGALVQSWLEWLEGDCTIPRHYQHKRRACIASVEEALGGCVTLDFPAGEEPPLTGRFR